MIKPRRMGSLRPYFKSPDMIGGVGIVRKAVAVVATRDRNTGFQPVPSRAKEQPRCVAVVTHGLEARVTRALLALHRPFDDELRHHIQDLPRLRIPQSGDGRPRLVDLSPRRVPRV